MIQLSKIIKPPIKLIKTFRNFYIYISKRCLLVEITRVHLKTLDSTICLLVVIKPLRRKHKLIKVFKTMISKRNALGLLIGVLVVTVCDCLTSEQQLEIDTLVQDVFMAENRIPGVGVTIVENFGYSVYTKGYGFADLERNITANENTKFCIASITKVTFSAF